MALLIREDEVKQVLTMRSAIEAVEQAMKEHALGLAVNIPRERTRIQKGRAAHSSGGRWKAAEFSDTRPILPHGRASVFWFICTTAREETWKP